MLHSILMSTERRTLGVWSRKRPLGPNGEKICYNCGGPLPKGRPYNCSAECSEQWRCKTSPSYLRYVIHKRDRGVCALCRLDTDALKEQYRKHRNSLKGSGDYYASKDQWLKDHGIPWSRTTGDWWDADHIVPVIEGGGECGIENYRTLCIPCHQKVTAELRGRMADRSRQQKAEDRFARARAAGWKAPTPQTVKPSRRPLTIENPQLFS